MRFVLILCCAFAASALVGCLTIAVGYAQAMQTSPGLIAALISRSIGEASRIAAAAGGEEKTLLGLAGYGDLLASITQSERPEVIVGTALAVGRRDDVILATEFHPRWTFRWPVRRTFVPGYEPYGGPATLRA